jgi:rare lipoprotein A
LGIAVKAPAEQADPSGAPLEEGRAVRPRYFTVCALATVLLASAQPAGAGAAGDGLQHARTARDQAIERVHSLEVRLGAMQSQLTRRQERLDHAAQRFLFMWERERDADRGVRAAQAKLDATARAAYEAGAASALNMFLAASTPSDLVPIAEYVGRTLRSESAAVADIRWARRNVARQRAELGRRKDGLIRRYESTLRTIGVMERRVGRATAAASEASVEASRLEEAARRIERARTRAREAAARLAAAQPVPAIANSAAAQPAAGRYPDPQGPTWLAGAPTDAAADQARLLELLGPSQGRTCEIPPGLRPAGDMFSGLATWYGDPQGTAFGVPFDPALFTAANRWLPLGSFLRVRHGDRCAIVLVNDRGPYGDFRRVVDLSRAAGRYLGVGVSPITAEVLVPR